MMLNLDSDRWSELQHAYGSASDMPGLLKQLLDFPRSDDYTAEPWATIWSSLAHQGDVYPASFAAVPHVIHALASAPSKADFQYFHFPAWVEICRVKKQVEIPEDLRVAYFESLAQLPSLVAAVANRPWDSGFLACALSAIAAAKRHPVVAEVVLELATQEAAEECLAWCYER